MEHNLQHNYPEKFLTVDYTKNAYNQHGYRKVTYTTASLPRQMLTTKLYTMHFVIDNRNGRDKITFFDVLDNCECWKVKYVKWVLGSSVLVCLYAPTKVLSQILEPRFS